jgi:hypothetical protein
LPPFSSPSLEVDASDSPKRAVRCASTANRGPTDSSEALARTLVASMDQLPAPDHVGRDALLSDRLEEAADDRKPRAVPDAGQAGVIGQRFGQVVAQVPAQAEAVGHDPHQLPLRTKPLEEKHQLELEEDNRIDTRSPDPRVGVADQIAYERKVERPLQMPVDVVGRDEIVE